MLGAFFELIIIFFMILFILKFVFDNFFKINHWYQNKSGFIDGITVLSSTNLGDFPSLRLMINNIKEATWGNLHSDFIL